MHRSVQPLTHCLRCIAWCGLALMAGCATPPASPLLGTYSGHTFSGTRPIASETTFVAGPGGALLGTYWLAPAAPGLPRDHGQLRNCQVMAERQVRCNWHDRFGAGVFEARFSPDFARFDGQWGTGERTSMHLIWNGQRTP